MLRNHKTDNYTELCKKLGYSFENQELLLQALTRKTAIVEKVQKSKTGDSQRLEFLGDKVIGLAISSMLYANHPDWQEGQLTQTTSQLVSNQALSKIAAHLGLGKYLIMGTSDEVNHVRENKKALADTVESLFGAIFLDSNEDSKLIKKLVAKHWQVIWNNKLIKAITSGTLEEVNHCLTNKANPNAISIANNCCRSVLQLAIFAKDAYNKMELLLQHGADPDWQEGYTLIVREKDSINFFYKKEKYFDKNTALHVIVKNINLLEGKEGKNITNMVDLLIKYQANTEATDANGKSPLQIIDDNYDHKSVKEKSPQKQPAPKLPLSPDKNAKEEAPAPRFIA